MLERNFSIELLVDFTEVRLAIEPRAAGMAARGATEAQRNHIMEAIGRMIAADAGEDDALEADIAFHVAVVQASNNPVFWEVNALAAVALGVRIRRTKCYHSGT